MVGPTLNRLSFDLPLSESAERRVCRILILLLRGFPLGVPSQETWEVALSACLNFPTAPMWVWKVACLHRSELRWTSSTSRANRTSCSIVPQDHTKRILTSCGKKRKKNVKAGADLKFKENLEAPLQRTVHYKAPFSLAYIMWCRPAHKSHTECNCGMTTSVTENGKYEGKKRWFPRCISHEFVGVWTHTLSLSHTHAHTHTLGNTINTGSVLLLADVVSLRRKWSREAGACCTFMENPNSNCTVVEAQACTPVRLSACMHVCASFNLFSHLLQFPECIQICSRFHASKAAEFREFAVVTGRLLPLARRRRRRCIIICSCQSPSILSKISNMMPNFDNKLTNLIPITHTESKQKNQIFIHTDYK